MKVLFESYLYYESSLNTKFKLNTSFSLWFKRVMLLQGIWTRKVIMEFKNNGATIFSASNV